MTSVHKSSSRALVALGAAGLVATLALPSTAVAAAAYPSDTAKPDPITLLQSYGTYWASASTPAAPFAGAVADAAVMSRDDQLVVWINNHATAAQQFLALQDSLYDNAGTAYDQSITVGTGLGSVLGAAYIAGRNSGALPKTTALINSETGTAGAYLSTGVAKAAFSHPRPYLPTDPTEAAPAGDNPGCDPATYNGAGQASIRVGKAWADADGNLLVNRVAATTDTTKQFAPNDVPLDPDYATDTGICTGGSFPSGHTLTAYEAGITLATLVPELAPEVLTRASENGINRNVLGVHYPLDIMGGRIAGQAALAARWSDATFRDQVLVPARTELVDYLQQACGGTLAVCIARQQTYTSNPFGGAAMPGGTAQIVTDRVSALATFTERLTYGFPRVTAAGQPASVPAGASNLLLTTFPTLTDAQRTAVLAQTEIDSGFPLDGTGTAAGGWERLNLAAATSATVQVAADGSLRVTATGGTARVVATAPGTTTPPPTTPPTSVGPILANTGADTTPLALVSLILLVSGGAILVGSHRLGRREGAHRG